LTEGMTRHHNDYQSKQETFSHGVKLRKGSRLATLSGNILELNWIKLPYLLIHLLLRFYHSSHKQ